MRILKKVISAVAVILGLLIIVYLLGPHPEKPHYAMTMPVLPSDADSLDQLIRKREASLPVKPDNQARIVWADSTKKQQTEYAVVYLHGFSASQGEGDPVHRNFARRFGCNLYLARLADHGLKSDSALKNFSPDRLWASALEAYAIGRKIGKQVILMGTSNGGVLALRLAASAPEIKGLLLYSPCVAINNSAAWIANNPWGLQIVRLVTGGDYKYSNDTDPKALQYWNSRYCIDAIPQLQEQLETSNSPELYGKVKQPVLMLYYYKDEAHQDATAKVDAMLKMFSQLGTTKSQKRQIAIPDAGTHVITSPIFSKDVASAEWETELFAKNILGMKPAAEK